MYELILTSNARQDLRRLDAKNSEANSQKT